MTAAARHPEPERRPATGADATGFEQAPEWAGDADAAGKFRSPADIRAALLPEQQDAFDAAFDVALTAARKTLQLDELQDMMRVWRRQALLTEQDPEGQRHMLAAAAEVQRTGRPRAGTVSWSELKTEFGL